MWNRKRDRITQLERQLKESDDRAWNHYLKVNELTTHSSGLARQIHEMDQQLFQMSQKSSWEEMRPYFNNIMIDVNTRMAHENERIANLMHTELEKTYGRT